MMIIFDKSGNVLPNIDRLKQLGFQIEMQPNVDIWATFGVSNDKTKPVALKYVMSSINWGGNYHSHTFYLFGTILLYMPRIEAIEKFCKQYNSGFNNAPYAQR